MTLEDCIGYALKLNPNVKALKLKVDKAETYVNEISSMFYPKIGFNASYTRLSDVPDFQISVPIFPTPITVQESVLNNFNLKLGFTQPLFTGFKLSSMKNASKYKVESEDYNSKAETNKIVFQVIDAFYSALKAGDIYSLLRKYSEALEAHLADTKAFLDNGLVTYNDYLKIELELARLEQKKIDAGYNYNLARNRLGLLTGMGVMPHIRLVEEEYQDTLEIKLIPAQLIRHAKENRYELLGLQQAGFAADEMIEAGKSEYYPSVYLFGNLHYNNPNQRYMPVEDKFNESWDAGVSFQWEIWNWGGTSSRVKQAAFDKEILNQNKKYLTEVIENEIYAAFISHQSKADIVKLNKEAVKSATENYRLMKVRYSQQLATSAELIDAETMLLDAEINLSIARKEVIVAERKLKLAAGYKLYKGE
ncbi:MAG: transporter [Melioribacteraceae bacterium]|nr:MAG: transporter [Melioribacteraceae bacterium]